MNVTAATNDATPELTPGSVICPMDALVPNSGVSALVGDVPMALFYLPDETPSVYALDNLDPFSGARVLGRGIVGDKAGELVVASPIYKQHFSLLTGRCLEDASVQLAVYPVAVSGEQLVIAES